MAVFDAVICKHFSVHVKKHCFLILHGMVLTHALWNETFLYSEVPSSFLVNAMQTLSKSVYNCQSYWQKFRGTFFMAHCVLCCILSGESSVPVERSADVNDISDDDTSSGMSHRWADEYCLSHSVLLIYCSPVCCRFVNRTRSKLNRSN